MPEDHLGTHRDDSEHGCTAEACMNPICLPRICDRICCVRLVPSRPPQHLAWQPHAALAQEGTQEVMGPGHLCTLSLQAVAVFGVASTCCIGIGEDTGGDGPRALMHTQAPGRCSVWHGNHMMRRRISRIWG